MLTIKILIAICAIFLIIFITKTCSYGMRVRIHRARSDNHHNIYKHKIFSNLFLSLLIAIVLLIEISVRLGIMPKPDTRTLMTHITSSAFFLILFLAIRFRFNGIDYPQFHKFLAYLCLVGFLFALTSGTIMLWNL